jgi:hypothetical protein
MDGIIIPDAASGFGQLLDASFAGRRTIHFRPDLIGDLVFYGVVSDVNRYSFVNGVHTDASNRPTRCTRCAAAFLSAERARRSPPGIGVAPQFGPRRADDIGIAHVVADANFPRRWPLPCATATVLARQPNLTGRRIARACRSPLPDVGLQGTNHWQLQTREEI